LNKKLAFRTGALIFSLLLFSCILFVVFGPLISLFEIKRGVENKDEAVMERFIDFEKLQENVKLKMRKQASKTFGFEEVDEDSLMAHFAMNIADQIINLAVENVISPAGLALMLDGADLNELLVPEVKQKRASKPANKENSFISLWRSTELNFEGMDRAVISVSQTEKAGKKDSPVRLVFLRHGMIWKLVDFNSGND